MFLRVHHVPDLGAGFSALVIALSYPNSLTLLLDRPKRMLTRDLFTIANFVYYLVNKQTRGADCTRWWET